MHLVVENDQHYSMDSEFSVNVSFQGKTIVVPHVTTSTTGIALLRSAGIILEEDVQVKMMYKGKKVELDEILFTAFQKKPPKVLLMASSSTQIAEIQEKRSDPTIRGFDQERSVDIKKANDFWGPTTSQDSSFRFCRFHACTWQSFGHRPTDETPHAFRAMELLERLATDPGIVAIMKERELVVGTLGEMDPIDDRLMKQKQQQNPGTCLLGYNTNGGMRIDLKLREDNLRGFRPYSQIAATLIHELSHNWVGEHNLLFWTNYGQMRAEYLHTHLRLRSFVHKGSTTAALAGLSKLLLLPQKGTADVCDFVMAELQREMAQFGLHPNSIAPAIQQRCREMDETHKGQRLGGGGSDAASRTGRDMALEAAERRAEENRKNKDP